MIQKQISKKKTYQNPSVLWAEGFFASENEIYLCGFYVFYAKSCVWTGKTEAFMVVQNRIEVKTGGMREPMPSPENMEENKMEQYKKEFIDFLIMLFHKLM